MHSFERLHLYIVCGTAVQIYTQRSFHLSWLHK
jgi:hypothetical protein